MYKDAIDFLNQHRENTGVFKATRFKGGSFEETEIKHTYTGVIQYLTVFTKYVQHVNLKTGKMLIANTLYKF